MVNEFTPQITVITPVYNGQDFIAETIKSVLSQQGNILIEYIVINDGSTDATGEILEKFKDSLTIVEVKNGGEAAAVNVGIAMARAPLAMVVSADDPIRDPSIFSASIFEHNKCPEISATYVDWAIINETGETIGHKETKEFSLQELIGYTNCLPGPGSVFSTEKAREILGRSPSYRFVSDYDFWLRLSSRGPFKRIPQELAQWRTHQGSTTVSAGGNQMAEEKIEVIKDFLAKNTLPAKLRRQALSHAYYYAARLSLDFQISIPRTLLLKSFIIRRKWPERAKVLVVLAILLYPLPRAMIILRNRSHKFFLSKRAIPHEN